MAANIPEDLRAFGITEKDFFKKKNSLAKSSKDKISEDIVIWGILKDLTKKAINYETLQMLFWNMAIFKDERGQKSFEYQQKSHISRLKDLEQKGNNKVKINATGCSSSCQKMHNLVLPIEKALQNLPIPNPNCNSKLNSSNTLCVSIFLVAKDD